MISKFNEFYISFELLNKNINLNINILNELK